MQCQDQVCFPKLPKSVDCLNRLCSKGLHVLLSNLCQREDLVLYTVHMLPKKNGHIYYPKSKSYTSSMLMN